MPTLEENKIVIRIPSFTLKSFLSLRFGIAVILLASLGVLAYWVQAIRPFVWIPMAHVDAFSIALSSDFSGRVTADGPQEGCLIRKGELLFAVDSGRNFARMNEIESQKKGLAEAIRSEKERMDKAMQEYLSASAEIDLGVGSQESADQSLSEFEQAQMRMERASQEMAALSRELAQMEEKKMFAPFDAIVLKKAKNGGEQVSLGEPVFLLSDPKQIWVEAEVPETELGRIEINMPARVRLAAYPGKEFSGRIVWISPATTSKIAAQTPSGQNEKVAVKISIDAPDVVLKPGLSAEVGLKVR